MGQGLWLWLIARRADADKLKGEASCEAEPGVHHVVAVADVGHLGGIIIRGAVEGRRVGRQVLDGSSGRVDLGSAADTAPRVREGSG